MKSLRGTTETGIKLEGWKTSLTKIIPKVVKPKALQELRPITLTNQGYKLMMGVIRLYIEDHLMNKLEKEVQGGFAEGMRLENNLFILRYCVEKSYK